MTNLNDTLKPEVGNRILFPTGIRYKHAARAVGSGRKYALVIWASRQSSAKLFPQASHSPHIST
jgi:hypothetical protein